MWSICKKELNQFFSNLTGYIAIILFLLINGIFLYVLPDSSILEYGYAVEYRHADPRQRACDVGPMISEAAAGLTSTWRSLRRTS